VCVCTRDFTICCAFFVIEGLDMGFTRPTKTAEDYDQGACFVLHDGQVRLVSPVCWGHLLAELLLLLLQMKRLK